MNRRAWYLVGGAIAVAILTGYLVKSKTAQTDALSNDQSQLPADQTEANYSVPPDIGLSVDNTSGLTVPAGSQITYSQSQGNSLPTT
jgi:hypothetical protein